MRTLKAVCCAAALAALIAPGARADEWNKKTFLTFSGPVQVPGATLPAGTYTFELANPDTTRHVIRVSSQDGTQVMAMFMTIPSERLDTPDENLVMFSERPAGVPQAVQAWFYPGDRIGEEFVYPKKQALEIAKATHKSVLATDDETSATTSESERMAAMKGASVGRVDESGQMTAHDRTAAQTAPATTTSETSTSTTTAPRAAQGTTAAQPEPAPTTAAAQPPRTAPEAPTTAERPRTTTSERAVGTSGQASATEPSSAQPSTAQPSTARPSTARPSTAQPSTAQPSTAAPQSDRPARLPRTASSLTTIELLSGLTLFAALGVRQLRRRFAAESVR